MSSKDAHSQTLIRHCGEMVQKGQIKAIWIEDEDYGIGCLFEEKLISLFDRVQKQEGICYKRGYNETYETPLVKVPFPGDVLRIGVKSALFIEYLTLSIIENEAKPPT